jgi:retron-type reverse transcriptase
MLIFFSSMLEQILDYRNVQKALKQVISNQGAGGIDGMGTDEIRDYLEGNWPLLKQSILEGSYRPQPVRKVVIPKPQGGTGNLGISTVVDRLIGQAISQWLSASRNFRQTATGLERDAVRTRQCYKPGSTPKKGKNG